MVDKTSINKDIAFDNLYKELQGLGTTYLSIIVIGSDSNVLLSKASNPDWASEFIGAGLYRDCHLLQEGSRLMHLNKNAGFTLAWDMVSPVEEKQKILEEIRMQKDIMHGVGFCSKDFMGNKIFLNIAGKYSDVNFGLNVLKNRRTVYRKMHSFLVQAMTLNIN